MTVLVCSSMAHVVDRAVAFRFMGQPWTCESVSPNGVTLAHGSERLRIEAAS